MAKRKITSKQVGVKFMYCADPVIIDKRGSWGDNEDNYQDAPNGAYLKVNSDGVSISHLVQPNDTDGKTPLGWVKGDKPGTFDKAPIWVDMDNILESGQTIEVKTRDNEKTFKYDIKEPSVMCYNDKDGKPDESDPWPATVESVVKNYNV